MTADRADSPTTEIQGIVFDYGGVFTVERVTDGILRAYESLLGWEPGALRQHLFGSQAWIDASRGVIDLETYWALVGRPLEPLLPSSFLRFRRGPFGVEPLQSEIVAMARRLKGRYRLALCSNALVTLREELARGPGLERCFQAIVVSAEVGLRKPDPRIYELVAERLGLPVRSCLLIDDKERNTSAARAIGMAAITFTSPAALARSLSELGIQV